MLKYLVNRRGNKVNIDTGALLRYVSANYFKSPNLTKEVEGVEVIDLPSITDKYLYLPFRPVLSTTALKESGKIVNALGGMIEKTNYLHFIQHCHIVESRLDEELWNVKCPNIPFRSKKFSDNDILIFGTGRKLGIPTLSTDVNFYKSCMTRGICLQVMFVSSIRLNCI